METRGFLTNPKSKKRWTTLSVDIELKDKLDIAMIKIGKRQSYNALLNSILDQIIK